MFEYDFLLPFSLFFRVFSQVKNDESTVTLCHVQLTGYEICIERSGKSTSTYTYNLYAKIWRCGHSR